MSNETPGSADRASHWLQTVLLCFALAVTTSAVAGGVDCRKLRKPETGQAGKDVVWVPTSDLLSTKMLELASVTASDRVYDLGAGDGIIPITAARKFGARAVGVEYDAGLARLANCLVLEAKLQDKVEIIQGDIFEYDFSSATVVTLYLLPELNLRLRPTLLGMKPGTRIVSHSWLMDEWEPDGQTSADNAQAYLWIVPANVAGTWTFKQRDGGARFTVQLDQSFQNLKGRIASGETSRPLWQSRIRGADLEFSFADASSITRVSGRVDADRIDARVTRGDRVETYEGRRL